MGAESQPAAERSSSQTAATTSRPDAGRPKDWFARFFAAAPGRLHFAAHSHHYWLDAALEAHQRSAEDTARLADHKWEHVFGAVLPAARACIARILNLPDPASIVFAPSTHDLLIRVLSVRCGGAPMRVLTTDSEYHSARRQFQRFAEEGWARVTVEPVEPFDTFQERMTARAAAGGYDVLFFSEVFFNSGFRVPDVAAIVAAVPDPDALVVVDGYHAFCALPVDLTRIQARAFYLAGSYKYAMSGEGACFMHCPAGYGARPPITGWMASFGTLSRTQDASRVPYAAAGMRFFGATMDMTAVYRLRAALEFLEREGMTVPRIHAHVERLQESFLARLEAAAIPGLGLDRLVPPRPHARGHFLTFSTPEAAAITAALQERGVVVDHRADRLRFGFGIYHDESDVERFVAHLAEVGRDRRD